MPHACPILPTLNLTARNVDAIRAPESGRVDYWDEKVSGLALRVSDQGTKTWIVRYRVKSGKQRRETIGRYPDRSLAEARIEAQARKVEVAKGGDPVAASKIDKNLTFSALADRYIDDYAKLEKRSWRKDRTAIDRDLNPVLGSMVASEIRRADIREALQKIRARGADIQANRTHEIVRRIFNWALDRDLLPETMANPAARIERAPERAGDRVLSPDEIKAVWASLDAEDTVIQRAFRLRLVTAQRGGEIQHMHCDQLSSESDGLWWTIPAEIAKNGLSHRVPLSPLAENILGDMKEGFVFESPKTGRPLANLWHPITEIRKRSEVDFRPHDLRRTAASHMTGMGVQRLTVGKILNHVEAGVTRVYDRHSYDKEKRDGLARWNEALTRMCQR